MDSKKDRFQREEPEKCELAVLYEQAGSMKRAVEARGKTTKKTLRQLLDECPIPHHVETEPVDRTRSQLAHVVEWRRENK